MTAQHIGSAELVLLFSDGLQYRDQATRNQRRTNLSRHASSDASPSPASLFRLRRAHELTRKDVERQIKLEMHACASWVWR